MSLFRVTVVQRMNYNFMGTNVYLEPGMSVEIPTRPGEFLSRSSAANDRRVADAFMRIYGVDITKAPKVMIQGIFEVEQIG